MKSSMFRHKRPGNSALILSDDEAIPEIGPSQTPCDKNHEDRPGPQLLPASRYMGLLLPEPPDRPARRQQ